MNTDSQKKLAFQFIIFLGIVSLFGDITYEGARSVTGPYLGILGASSSIVGLVAGIGEFIGYAIRLVSGYLADKTERYWLITFIGYGLLLCVPVLAFTGYWQLAAGLIVLERLGKAIRTPARDVILSHATKQVGRGWGFGIHEALDQVGAIIGPLLFSVVFLLHGSYRNGFSILWLPATLALAILLVARLKVPFPQTLEMANGTIKSEAIGKHRLPRKFLIYALFTFLSVAGFASFQLISYRLKIEEVIPDFQIPLFYAVAMGIDAVVALIIGRIYDRIGIISLIIVPFITMPISALVFSHSYGHVVAGVVLWGAVMGIHETVMRASVADMTPIKGRGLAYGIFNTVYGTAWLVGSAVMGQLYEISVGYLVLFSIAMEVISIPVLLMVKKS